MAARASNFGSLILFALIVAFFVARSQFRHGAVPVSAHCERVDAGAPDDHFACEVTSEPHVRVDLLGHTAVTGQAWSVHMDLPYDAVPPGTSNVTIHARRDGLLRFGKGSAMLSVERAPRPAWVQVGVADQPAPDGRFAVDIATVPGTRLRVNGQPETLDGGARIHLALAPLEALLSAPLGGDAGDTLTGDQVPLTIEAVSAEQQEDRQTLSLPGAGAMAAVHAALGGVSGNPIPWAATATTKPPRAAVVVLCDDDDSDGAPEGAIDCKQPARKLVPANGLGRLSETQLVVLRYNGEQEVESCGPYGDSYAYVTRWAHYAKLTAYEARTGKKVAEKRFDGTWPRECQDREEFETIDGNLTGISAIHGDDPDEKTITIWLAGL